jgi:hypothetical protein
MYRKKHKKTQRGGVLGFKKNFPNANNFLKKTLREVGIIRSSPTNSTDYESTGDTQSSSTPSPASPPLTVQEISDIGESTIDNTLDNKRILKAQLISDLLTSHNPFELVTDDEIFSFYLINSVKTDRDGNIIVSAKKIKEKSYMTGNISLSKNEYMFTLKQDNEKGKYKVVTHSAGTRGVISHDNITIVFTISNFTVTDLETIERGYKNPITIESNN